MATHIGIGFSEEVNTAQAILTAASQAKEQIKDKKVHLVVIVNTIHYSPLETLLIVRKVLNPERLIGSSCAGIILSELISLRGIAILAISSDEMNFGIGQVSDIEASDKREAGAVFAHNATSNFGHHRRQAFIFFIDGLLGDTSPFIKGVQEVFGNVFPVIGAGSIDDFHFKKTYQYFQDKPLSGSATGVLLGGSLRIAVGSKHGWKPLGKPRFITQVKGNIIKTIDDKKAVSIYGEFFGEEAKNLQGSQLTQLAILYPLGIYLSEEKDYLLRNPVEILADGSIVCQGDIPQDAEIHLMIGNKDACRQAAAAAAQEIKDTLAGHAPKLLIIFECLGRQKLLGRGAFGEIQTIKEVLGQNIPIFGMYSHGEISPLSSYEVTKKTYLQNETIVILGIG